MRPDEYAAFDATALADCVRRGEVSPSELTEAAIQRIDALNPTLNAVVERCYDLAREAALRTDLTAAFAGVPFLAKDLYIDVAGLHLTASCRWLSGLPPATRDAPLAARWRAAGLTILGRTNTPEFAAEFVTESAWRGPTRNPWDLTRTPGGSSGGAAAAVASGMVPLAHGTDSGGSIRVPAAACGLVGFKPSRGWVPGGPHLDELSGGLDCEHVLTRSVRDTARMLDLTAGPEATSRVPLRTPLAGFSANLSAAPTFQRIGISMAAPGGLLPHAEIGAALDSLAARLSRAGHRVSDAELPASANVGEPAAIIGLTAIAEEIDFYRHSVGRDPEAHELEDVTRAALDVGARHTALDYARARRALTVATRDMAELFGRYDLLLLPTTADLPVRIGQIYDRTQPFDLERWNADAYRYAPYTELFNATGQPAISLPLAMSASGLPIGLQLVAPLGEDARLLAMAAWLEREMPWAERLAELRSRYPVR